MAGLQGKVFAGYQLAAQIGTGGIAEVYRGRALTGGREVAVKIITSELARDPAFQQRFHQSVQAAARLANHPHVLPVLASGEERGSYYLVTPFVQEGTLRDMLRGGFRLGAGDVAPFLRQLGSALDYAHQLGVVHGNLKPANIYLFEGRHVLLGDFGLLWDVARLEMKRKGAGAEAVECFAPEVFSGQITPASDIYSLGATLFTTLTGRAPFVGKTPADVYNAHMRQPVPPVQQVDPKLPAALRALDPVIAQAMAKRPEERFPSAGAMVQAVEMATQPAGVGARPGVAPSMGPGIASGPVAGGFGAAGVMPGTAQGAMAGVMAGVMPGAFSSPLQPLDFPPLPSSEEASGLMDEGHIAANLNEAAAQAAQQPFRAPGAPQPAYPPGMNPLGGLTPGMTPPGMTPPGVNGGMTGGVTGGVTGGAQSGFPPTFPPQVPPSPMPPMSPMPPIGAPNGPQAPQPGFVPGLGPIPLGGPGQGPVPSAPMGPIGPDASRAQKGYSATELNLPRLTHIELGPLAPGIEQRMQEQIGAGQAETYDGTQVVAAPTIARTGKPSGDQDRPRDDEEWDESQSYSAMQSAYDDSRENQSVNSMSAEWSVEQSAAYAAPRSEWDYSEELSVQRPTSRRRSGEWDEDASAEMERYRGDRGGRRRGSSRRDDYDEYDDTRYDRHSRGRRNPRRDYDDYDDDEPRRSGGLARGLLIALIPLVLLTLAGVAVLRPDLCPVSACQKASDKIHQLVPGLGGGNDGGSPASTAPLVTSPAQIQLSTPAGTAVSASLALTNSGTGDVTWQASTGLQWVTLTPANGSVLVGGNATVKVEAKPTTDTAPSTYTTTITVTVGAATVSVPLQVTVSGS